MVRWAAALIFKKDAAQGARISETSLRAAIKKWRHPMKVPMMALVLCTAFSVNAQAQAGLCTRQIDQFEAAMPRSPIDSNAGPTALETIGAKLGRQPTPASIAAAEAGAQSQFASLMAQARALDARGKHKACMRILADVKQTFALQ
jgi:hypothetical protein